MNFANVMSNKAQTKLTENGAVSYDRLNNSLVTLFGQIGALRPRSKEEIEDKFAFAFNNDNLLATKMMFYAGDIRSGLGERRTFRICLHWLAKNYPEIVKKNLHLIPYFNRWDSIFELIDTPCEDDMWDLIDYQIAEDIKAYQQDKPCSLLTKWMPSCNASSKKTRQLAKKALYKLGYSEREYRRMLSTLRAYIKVIERDMSLNNWDKINYEMVPSRAMSTYGNAFQRHDMSRFDQYIADINSGTKKVNAKVLYPYDIVRDFTGRSTHKNPLAEQQWKALPNYIEGENDFIVMADVSGSMTGRPMDTSIGLAIYFAERNKGNYHNLYMTFTDKPRFIKINEGATLREKVRQVMNTNVGYNTDLERAFDYILQHAINSNINPDEMPKALIVISDMEIDRYIKIYGLDFVEEMKKKFESFGYSMPRLFLWNVEARNDTFLSQSEDVIYVSGQSVSSFKYLCGSLEGKTAYDFMLEVLDNKRYDCISI